MTSCFDDNPWITAAERVYGPLADAIGWRGLRQIGDCWRELAAAQTEELDANIRIASVFTAAAIDGCGRLSRRLEQLGGSGETVSSPIALLRLGLREFDGAMHSALLSEAGLAATAASVRAAARRRIGIQKAAEIGAATIGQPTRVEVDEAFREIQQLKRKLRKLERAVAGNEMVMA